MPIANCIVSPNCPEGGGDFVKIWADESGQSPKHMTVNIIGSRRQIGRGYLVMATLSLPSMWADPAVSLLQIGLSKAIENYFSIANEQIHIVTNIIGSGRVVEAGREITWP